MGVPATDADGNSAGALEAKEGETYWVPVENGEVAVGDLRAPATHNATNIGANRYREILVEVKQHYLAYSDWLGSKLPTVGDESTTTDLDTIPAPRI